MKLHIILNCGRDFKWLHWRRNQPRPGFRRKVENDPSSLSADFRPVRDDTAPVISASFFPFQSPGKLWKKMPRRRYFASSHRNPPNWSQKYYYGFFLILHEKEIQDCISGSHLSFSYWIAITNIISRISYSFAIYWIVLRFKTSWSKNGRKIQALLISIT